MREHNLQFYARPNQLLDAFSCTELLGTTTMTALWPLGPEPPCLVVCCGEVCCTIQDDVPGQCAWAAGKMHAFLAGDFVAGGLRSAWGRGLFGGHLSPARWLAGHGEPKEKLMNSSAENTMGGEEKDGARLIDFGRTLELQCRRAGLPPLALPHCSGTGTSTASADQRLSGKCGERCTKHKIGEECRRSDGRDGEVGSARQPLIGWR